jgi:hypothetical protein
VLDDDASFCFVTDDDLAQAEADLQNAVRAEARDRVRQGAKARGGRGRARASQNGETERASEEGERATPSSDAAPKTESDSQNAELAAFSQGGSVIEVPDNSHLPVLQHEEVIPVAVATSEATVIAPQPAAVTEILDVPRSRAARTATWLRDVVWPWHVFWVVPAIAWAASGIWGRAVPEFVPAASPFVAWLVFAAVSCTGRPAGFQMRVAAAWQCVVAYPYLSGAAEQGWKVLSAGDGVARAVGSALAACGPAELVLLVLSSVAVAAMAAWEIAVRD